MLPQMCPYCCIDNLQPVCVEEESNSAWYCPKCKKQMIIYTMEKEPEQKQEGE